MLVLPQTSQAQIQDDDAVNIHGIAVEPVAKMYVQFNFILPLIFVSFLCNLQIMLLISSPTPCYQNIIEFKVQLNLSFD